MKPYYCIELHAHTKESSPAAEIPAAELVERYIAKGYDGVVITDHLCPRKNFQDWNTEVDHFLAGYKAAKTAAGDYLKVYLGMEIQLTEYQNHYLVYGFDEQFLRTRPHLYDTTIPSFYDMCHDLGIRVFQAHPSRYGMARIAPRWLDGLEIYDGSSDSHNMVSSLWCDKENMPAISGSNFHKAGDEGRGGIILPYLPEDDRALAEALFCEERILMMSEEKIFT